MRLYKIDNFTQSMFKPTLHNSAVCYRYSIAMGTLSLQRSFLSLSTIPTVIESSDQTNLTFNENSLFVFLEKIIKD